MQNRSHHNMLSNKKRDWLLNGAAKSYPFVLISFTILRYRVVLNAVSLFVLCNKPGHVSYFALPCHHWHCSHFIPLLPIRVLHGNLALTQHIAVVWSL